MPSSSCALPSARVPSSGGGVHEVVQGESAGTSIVDDVGRGVEIARVVVDRDPSRQEGKGDDHPSRRRRGNGRRLRSRFIAVDDDRCGPPAVRYDGQSNEGANRHTATDADDGPPGDPQSLSRPKLEARLRSGSDIAPSVRGERAPAEVAPARRCQPWGHAPAAPTRAEDPQDRRCRRLRGRVPGAGPCAIRRPLPSIERRRCCVPMSVGAAARSMA